MNRLGRHLGAAVWRVWCCVATRVDDNLAQLDEPPADHPVWRAVTRSDCHGHVEGHTDYCVMCLVAQTQVRS